MRPVGPLSFPQFEKGGGVPFLTGETLFPIKRKEKKVDSSTFLLASKKKRKCEFSRR